MSESELLERARASLGADSVVIAAVAGNADRTYNLTVNHERNAAFEGHGSGKTKNAGPSAAARNQILKSLAGALEPYGDVMT